MLIDIAIPVIYDNESKLVALNIAIVSRDLQTADNYTQNCHRSSTNIKVTIITHTHIRDPTL